MLEIKHSYDAIEIASALGVTVRTIQLRAVKENWSSINRQGQGGGKTFPFETLPAEVKAHILSSLFATGGYAGNADLPFDEIHESLKEFESMPESARQTARARMRVVQASREYIRANKTGVEAGRNQFSELYRLKSAPGVPADAYEWVRKCSRSTLDNWETALRTGGLPALAPRNYKCGRHRKLTPDMKVRFISEISAIPHTRGTDLFRLLKRHYPKDMWPHRATVFNWFKLWKKENAELYEMLKNPGSWKSRYQPSMGTLARAPHAGHTWEMDSTPADVMTADGKRCVIVAAIDVYSRRVIVVVSHTSTSDAVAACIRKAILAWGVPSVIMKDNGADYSSLHIEAACTSLDIETPQIKPYTPEGKGHIERFFGTLTRELEERLPYFTGHNVQERAGLREQQTWAKRVLSLPKNDEAVGVPLSMGELQHFIDAWANDIYEQRIHSGFERDHGQKLKGLTPRQAFDRSPIKPPTIFDVRTLDILLSNLGKRKVAKDGIRYLGERYVAPELVDWIGYEVVVKIDPENAGALYVFHKNDFVGIARNEALTGQTLTDYMEAKNSKQKRIKGTVRALKDLSKNMHLPYTHELAVNKLSSASNDEMPSLVEFRPGLYNDAVQGARDALAAKDGLADKGPGGIQPFNKVIHPKAVEQEDPWAKPPVSILSKTIAVFDWYKEKQDAVGLTEADANMMIRLWEEFSEIQMIYKKPNRVSDTQVTVEAAKL